MFALEK